MKVSVLAHCSHNKGDNSVLSFIDNMIKNEKNIKSSHVSTSSGDKPFWLTSNSTTTYWGCGHRFPCKDELLPSKVLRVLRNRFIDKLFYLVVFLYANNFDLLAKSLLKFVFNKQFKTELLDSDAVICTGGHHISSVLDKDGVNSQLLDMIYSVINNKKLYLWAQSIGPVKTNKKYILKAIAKLLNSAQYICYRDSDSEAFIKNLGVKTLANLVDDSVFGLRHKLVPNLDELTRDGDFKRKAVIAVYTAGKLKSKTLDDYKKTLLTVIDYLINIGYSVELLPMQYKGLQDDERPFLNDLKESSSNINLVKVLENDMSPEDTLNYLKNTNLLIGHKTHSVVYGLALAIPTIAISYHPKTTFFMSRFNMLDYVIDDQKLNSKLVVDKINLAIKNEADIKRNLIKESSVIGHNVIESFNKMIGHSRN
ncbi:polysaccharide pyruvyl transferase family protein [Vibrio cholerae]